MFRIARRVNRSPLLVAFFVSSLMLAGTPGMKPANAETATCNDPTPARYLPADDGVTTKTIDPRLTAAVAAAKAAVPDTEAANRPDPATNAAMNAAALVRKQALAAHLRPGSATILPDRATLLRTCLGQSATSSFTDAFAKVWAPSVALGSIGPGYAWVDNLNHQGQEQAWWCGPATLSEIANTEFQNARLPITPITQGQAASAMGTTQDGTGVGQMVSALNQYVGHPVSGSDWYVYVWVSTSQTEQDKSDFIFRLDFDVRNTFPIAGDANEPVGQPRLLNHPSNVPILHWFQVGGYSNYGDSTYYLDSATTVWSGVQPYNWFDTWTMILIFGGLGYAW
jgi:hypothetical protein